MLLNEAPRTSAEDIRRKLAAKIIDGQLLPGSLLDETLLAAEFSVSRTPIREALRQLVASGLVDQKPHTTAMVARPDERMLAGMFQVMGYLEALCAGLSATEMTSAERRILDAMHCDMSKIVRAGDAKAYALANEAFHNAIYRGSHNDYLAEITYKTRERVQPFRSAQFDRPGRLAKSHDEHGLVVDCIMRGDRHGAETQMRRHIFLVEDAYQKLSTGA